MQSPVIIFDHINQKVSVARQGNVTQDEKLQEALAAQRDQVTSSGNSPAR